LLKEILKNYLLKKQTATKKEEAKQKRHIEHIERQDRAIDAYERTMQLRTKQLGEV